MIGIDFGTTNSSVALYDGGALVPVTLDPANDNPDVLPSLIYLDREHRSLLGMAAAAEYTRQETGRPVLWEKRLVARVPVTVASLGQDPITYLHDMHVMVDLAARGRLIQSIKTGLRDPVYEGTDVFGRFYTIDELIGLILRALRVEAERRLGRGCRSVLIGRPVSFSREGDEAVTGRGEAILYRAARLAGFDEVRFQLEPIGAAYHYHRLSGARHTALVFDFGGGTLDLTIAEVGGAGRPRIIASRGVLVGGDDLDRAIMRHLLPHFGVDAALREGSFPPHLVELLTSWQTMPDLSRPAHRGLINHLKRVTTDPVGIRALEALVSHHLGFDLFRQIERTKRRLSAARSARLDFVHDGIVIHDTITRDAFEGLIAAEVGLVERGVRRVLDDAGLRPAQVAAVVRTGGTSRVPAFIQLLARLFGEDKLVEVDPFTSVVGGLAVAAREGDGHESPWVASYAPNACRLIGGLRAGSGKQYELYELQPGEACYVDNPTCVTTRVPLALKGLPAVRTANLDKEAAAERFLRFRLKRAARVYVAYDGGAARLPGWLRPFAAEEMQIEVDYWGDPVLLRVYGRDYTRGPVALGGNQAQGAVGTIGVNYVVVVEFS